MYAMRISLFILCLACTPKGDQTQERNPSFQIKGNVSVVGDTQKDWMMDTEIIVNGGDYKGFLRSDGSFIVATPPGSFLIEVSSPNYVFQRYHVDITKEGKIQAHQANFLQPNHTRVVPYPLRYVARKPAAFFEVRKKWKV